MRLPSRREAAVLAAILFAGIALRGLYLQELRHDPLFAAPALDAQLHDYWARGLALGDWTPPPGTDDPRIRTTPFFRPPGYPYFLAAIYAVVGDGVLAPRLVQSALGLSSCLLAWAFARRWFGTAVGLVLAGFMALHWVFVYFEGQWVDPALLTFLVLAIVMLLAWAADRGGFMPSAAAGVALGIAALVRPNVLVFAPFALGWLLWASRRRDPMRPRLAPAVGLVLGAALAIAPATLRNAAVAGEWVLISSNGGINLHIGNNAEADGIHAAVPGIRGLIGKDGWTCFDHPAMVDGLGRELGRELSHAEASRYWAGQAWSYILGQPGRVAWLTARRAALFWGPAELEDRDVGLTRQASTVLRRIPIGFPIVLAAALAGGALFVLDRRRRDPRDGPRPRGRTEVAVLATLLIATYSASFLPFFFNARYRVPILPLLGLFGAYGVVQAARAARGRRTGRVVGWTVATLALFLLASINLSGYEAAREHWHYQLGNAYRAGGDDARAIEQYREAVRIRPAYAVARNDLAVLLLRAGEVDDAVSELRAAIEADPGGSDARFNLANVLVRQGRVGEALEEFRRGLDANPLDVQGRVAYGSALLLGGDAESALRQYERAREIRPGESMVHVALGRAYLRLGRTAEAAAALAEAARLAPDLPLPRFLLGELARRQGRPEEARRLYREALEIDPAFAPAARALGALTGPPAAGSGE